MSASKIAEIARLHRSVSLAPDKTTAIRQLLDDVRHLTNAGGAALVEVNTAQARHFGNGTCSFSAAPHARVDASFVERLSNRPFLDAADCATLFGNESATCAIGVPIHGGGEVIALMIAADPEAAPFDDETIATLTLAGSAFAAHFQPSMRENAELEHVDMLSDFFDSNPFIFGVVEALPADDFRYLAVNKRAARHLGLTAKQMVGARASCLGIPASSLAMWGARFAEARRSGGLLRFRFSRGERNFRSCIFPLKDEPGHLDRYCFVSVDCTEDDRRTEALILAERHASLGKVTAGVAHEIKNPLSFMLGNLDFIISELSGDSPLEREELEAAAREVRDGAHRIRSVTKDLLSFARPAVEAAELIDIGTPLQSAVKLAQSSIKGIANLVTEIQSGALVRGDPQRLSQVVLNLLLNAVDAIVPGRPGLNEVRVRSRSSDKFVVIEVEDTGSGIAPEHIDRLFEPFFTTKGDRGNGLGLATCRSIVASMGGKIEVESEFGQGTCFRIKLPQC